MWLVSKIADYLADDSMSEEERSILRYGLERITENLIGCLILVVLGTCFGNAMQGFLLWIFLYPLRSYAGGYHAATRAGCLCISVCAVLAAFLLLHGLQNQTVVHSCVCVVSAFLLWFLAPVGSQNKPLEQQEILFYQKRVRYILAAEILIAGTAVWMQWTVVYQAVAMACLIAAVSVMLGKWQMKRPGISFTV